MFKLLQTQGVVGKRLEEKHVSSLALLQGLGIDDCRDGLHLLAEVRLGGRMVVGTAVAGSHDDTGC
jgi:hypothetical protein